MRRAIGLGIFIGFFSSGCATPLSNQKESDSLRTEPQTISSRCDGYPRVALETPPGFCVGSPPLVGDAGIPIHPESLLRLGSLLLLADSGDSKKGIEPLLWALESLPTQMDGSRSVRQSIILNSAKLSKELREAMRGLGTLKLWTPPKALPNQTSWVYLAGTRSLLRFKVPAKISVKSLQQETAKTLEIILDRVPPKDEYKKALSFELSPDQSSILIAVPTAGNTCDSKPLSGLCSEAEGVDDAFPKDQKKAALKESSEAEQSLPKPPGDPFRDLRFHKGAVGILLHYPMDPKTGRILKGAPELAPKAVAVGLRTPETLYTHPKTLEIYTLESQIETTPSVADELNLISRNKHYGWPYCVEFNRPTPFIEKGIEPDWDCRHFDAPWMLLPPGSRPSSLLFYEGRLFPKWYSNRALIAMEGEWPAGGRIAAFHMDEKGYPQGRPLGLVFSATPTTFAPRALTAAPDGTLTFIDSSRNQLMHLFYDADQDATEGEGRPATFDQDEEWLYRGKLH